MPMPATTSRIDGAMLSRLAATATAASTAIMNSRVCTTAAIISSNELDRAGGDVHGQRQQRGRLKKNETTPCTADGAAEHLAGDRDVGDLRGHADDEARNRRSPSSPARRRRENSGRSIFAAALAVIFVRVVEREDRVDEGPGQQDGQRSPAPAEPRRAGRSACWPASATMATRLAKVAATTAPECRSAPSSCAAARRRMRFTSAVATHRDRSATR